jgi:hypothetical protein
LTVSYQGEFGAIRPEPGLVEDGIGERRIQDFKAILFACLDSQVSFFTKSSHKKEVISRNAAIAIIIDYTYVHNRAGVLDHSFPAVINRSVEPGNQYAGPGYRA